MAKLTPRQVTEHFRILMNCCVEGRTGEWDASTEEGRESFVSMHELLEDLVEHYGLDVSDAKEMP